MLVGGGRTGCLDLAGFATMNDMAIKCRRTGLLDDMLQNCARTPNLLSLK